MKKILTFTLILTLLLGLCACGEKETPKSDVDLAAFYESLGEKYELAVMTELDAELMEGFYPGLSAVETRQLVAYAPMMSAVVSEIVLVQVVDSADVQTVADILQARIDDQASGGAWYPESMESWAKARLVVHGDVVALIAVTNQADAIAADLEALLK